MVRQFADRHAFLRELVQKGIDAGATRIDVRVERSPDGAVRTTVEDDGCGMTRAIIEQLSRTRRSSPWSSTCCETAERLAHERIDRRSTDRAYRW